MKNVQLKEDPDAVYLNNKHITHYMSGPNIAFIIFRGDNNKDYWEVVDSRETHNAYASHASVRTKILNKYPNYSHDMEIIRGRIWPNREIASTYEPEEKVAKYADIIEKIFERVKLNPNDFGWDYGDSCNLKEFSGWVGKSASISKPTEEDPKLKAEMDDLIQKIHLATPAEKEKIRKRLSQLQKLMGGKESDLDSYINAAQDKIAKSIGNYDNQAQFNFYKGSIAEVSFEHTEREMPFPVSIKNVEDYKGYWISPEGLIYDVDSVGGHAHFAEDFIFNITDRKDWAEKVKSGVLKYNDIRVDALYLGWVRIRFHCTTFYRTLSKGKSCILEIQAKKINSKQKSILEKLVKEKNATSISAKDFEKYELAANRSRIMRTKFK